MTARSLDLGARRELRERQVLERLWGEAERPVDDLAERACLGCLLLDPESYWELVEYLTAEVFWNPRHRVIWNAFTTLFGREEAPDVVLLGSYLMESGDLVRVGGLPYLSRLTDDVASAATVTFYGQRIYRLYVRRQALLGLEASIAQMLQLDGSLEDALVQARQRLDLDAGLTGTISSISEHCHEALGRLDGTAPTTQPPISTNIAELDKLMGGRGPLLGENIGLLSPSGYGKTALGLCLATWWAFAGHSVVYLSGEMHPRHLTGRILSQRSGVPLSAIRNGQFSSTQQIEAVKVAMIEVAALPLHFDRDENLTATRVAARIRRYKQTLGAKIIILDYFQKLDLSDQDPRLNESARWVSAYRQIRQAIQDVGVQGWILLQPSDGHLTRKESPIPTMKDAQFSKNLIQEMDWGLVWWRQGYFEGDSHDRFGQIIVDKARSGTKGRVDMHWHGPTVRAWPVRN